MTTVAVPVPGVLTGQIVETNGVSQLVLSNADGHEVSIDAIGPLSTIEDAQAHLRNWLDAVKSARALSKTLEGAVATGKTDAEKEESARVNRERAEANLAVIYTPAELAIVHGGIERTLSECRTLVGDANFDRVMAARRNVPALAGEFLTMLGTAPVVATVEATVETVEATAETVESTEEAPVALSA